MLGQIAMGLERPGGRMFYQAESMLTYKRIYTFDQIREQIAKIDGDCVRNYIRDRFKPNHMCISGIGAFEEDVEQKIEKIIESYL